MFIGVYILIMRWRFYSKGDLPICCKNCENLTIVEFRTLINPDKCLLNFEGLHFLFPKLIPDLKIERDSFFLKLL